MTDYIPKTSDDYEVAARIHIDVTAANGTSVSRTKNNVDMALNYRGDMLRLLGNGIKISAYGEVRIRTRRTVMVKIGLVQSATSCDLNAVYGSTVKRGQLKVEHRVACPMKDSLNDSGVWYSDQSVTKQWVVEANTGRGVPFKVEIEDTVGDTFPLNYPINIANKLWPMKGIKVRKDFISCVMLVLAFPGEGKGKGFVLDYVRWHAGYEGIMQNDRLVPSPEGQDFYFVGDVEANRNTAQMPEGLKLDGPNVSHGETPILSVIG